MKKYNYFFVGLGIALFFICSLVLISSKETENDEVPPSLIPPSAVSVAIPDDVEFCGNRLSLDRLDLRERFDREINSLTYLHGTMLMYIKRANRFFPVIEPVLKKNGIPGDFKYLCVVESGLDTRALSPAKAAGLWQFMEQTGKSYNLEITGEVDERYHVEKATEAACHYLKSAYTRYGNWVDVAAAYNAGMQRISSEMEKQQVGSALDLLLVSETSRYVFRILAMKMIFENPARYGFILKKENLYPPVAVRYVEVTANIDDLALFAKENGINYMQLKEFNVWLRDTKLKVPQGKSYRIAIPQKEDLYYNRRKIKVHDDVWISR
ncbi:MAG: lytic transglycosylase domain-containing protein [Dysgonamonadaceae bacterium]|jgi:hypothetical protein|nr:lytic transglycosylase domain-containing protein [Dysgonamonadaceae bacterium]